MFSISSLSIQVAQNRAVRQTFIKFRSEHPDTFNWNVSQIPELAVKTEEQLAREAKRKQIQREKRKQRDKAKKIAQRQERVEQVVIFSNFCFITSEAFVLKQDYCSSFFLGATSKIFSSF